MINLYLLVIAFVSGSAVAAGGLTIQSLPSEPEEPYPVCRDVNGKLGNCTLTAGVDIKYLAPIVVDGDGIELGTLVGMQSGHNYSVLSLNNYLVDISVRDGTVNGIYSVDLFFDAPSCTGNVYADDFRRGTVFIGGSFDHSYPLYYVPRDEVKEMVQIVSMWNTGFAECFSYSAEQEKVPVSLNSPGITGVANKGAPSNPYTLPIMLNRP